MPVSRPISRSVIGRRTRASASLLETVFWIKIYLRHAKAAFDLLGLHDHINQQLEQAANVVTGQIGAALAFLDQQCQLFEREFRSEEHTSELQSLMRTSYSVFCLKKQKHTSFRHSCTPHNHTTPVIHITQHQQPTP